MVGTGPHGHHLAAAAGVSTASVLGKPPGAFGSGRAMRPSLLAEAITRALEVLRAQGRVRCHSVATAGRSAETSEAAL